MGKPRLFFAQKKRILDYRIANPDKSYIKIAEHFTQEFGIKLDYTLVYRIMKDRAKLEALAIPSTEVISKLSSFIIFRKSFSH